jgi:hypothetical protein
LGKTNIALKGVKRFSDGAKKKSGVHIFLCDKIDMEPNYSEETKVTSY